MGRSISRLVLLGLLMAIESASPTFSSEPAPPKMPSAKSPETPRARPAEKPEPASVAVPKSAEAPAKPSEKTAVKPAVKPHPVGDANDLEAFFDGALLVQLESKHIAGAVVAVVVGDKLVFAKGYGYADVETRRKVDPEKTLFRIASISKLFTWTAVMQLVEEGKIDLDADVNKYLKDLQIPATFEKPVTLKNLLTHTPGFEDHVLG